MLVSPVGSIILKIVFTPKLKFGLTQYWFRPKGPWLNNSDKISPNSFDKAHVKKPRGVMNFLKNFKLPTKDNETF